MKKKVLRPFDVVTIIDVATGEPLGLNRPPEVGDYILTQRANGNSSRGYYQASRPVVEEDLTEVRSSAILKVKAEATSRIALLDWKVNKYTEQAALGMDTKDKLLEVYVEREAIRSSSDIAEAAIAELSSADEIEDFVW